MRKKLGTIVLALTIAGTLAAGESLARPASAGCAICVAQTSMMGGPETTNLAGVQATALDTLRAAALARMEAMRSRLPG